ncbi:carboxymuconolactone decarboxylase family protein [Hydrogenimonas sp.]
MQEIEFINRRFDPDITPFDGIARQMAKAFGYTADLKIDKSLAQLLRLRVAQKNECAYCIILHARTAREIGIHESKVDNISSWYNSELFDEKEKAALAYCDVLNEGVAGDFQRYHDALCRFFDEREIAEIAAVVINMNVWTRLKLAQGATPVLKEKS